MRLIDADKILTNVIAISNSKGQVAWSAVCTVARKMYEKQKTYYLPNLLAARFAQ